MCMFFVEYAIVVSEKGVVGEVWLLIDSGVVETHTTPVPSTVILFDVFPFFSGIYPVGSDEVLDGISRRAMVLCHWSVPGRSTACLLNYCDVVFHSLPSGEMVLASSLTVAGDLVAVVVVLIWVSVVERAWSFYSCHSAVRYRALVVSHCGWTCESCWITLLGKMG